MGRLLNTLAKYVEITGSSQSVFKSNKNNLSTSLNKSQSSHLYSDVDLSSTTKSFITTKKNIYRSASQLHDDQTINLSKRQYDRNITPIQQEAIVSNQLYDQPKSYDNMTSIDRNNNQILIPPRPRERIKNECSLPSSQSSINLSSTENPGVRNDSTSSEYHRRRPHPLPRRSSIDYVSRFNNIFIKNPQTYDTLQSSCCNANRIQPSVSKRVYDIPIAIARPTKFIVPPFERYEKSTCVIDEDEETTYDNLSKSDGIGKFRFVIPFNHSPRSAFTTIKSINSPTSSSSSTISSNSTMPQTSSSSNYSNTNNNNSNNRTRLMTAV
jgi:hypothetical protein